MSRIKEFIFAWSPVFTHTSGDNVWPKSGRAIFKMTNETFVIWKEWWWKISADIDCAAHIQQTLLNFIINPTEAIQFEFIAWSFSPLKRFFSFTFVVSAIVIAQKFNRWSYCSHSPSWKYILYVIYLARFCSFALLGMISAAMGIKICFAYGYTGKHLSSF